MKTPEHFPTIPSSQIRAEQVLDPAPRVMIAPINSLGSTELLYSITTHPVHIILVRHVHATVGLKPSASGTSRRVGWVAVLN